MRLSARNQRNATVEEVNLGEVMATIRVTLPDGQKVTAAITKEATPTPTHRPSTAPGHRSSRRRAATANRRRSCSRHIPEPARGRQEP